jgi:ligand-binding sensor domain-containing protein
MLGKDLPMEPINVVKEDPKNENIIYVGTDGGLYVSFDNGRSFMAWNAVLPKSIPIHDIAFQERENEIILGTHGRSLYVASLDKIQEAAPKP